MIICPKCSAQAVETAYFCSNCGKKLREREVEVGFLPLAWLMILSIILPPFGLGLTLRYIKSANLAARIWGIVSLLLTVLALVYVLWSSLYVIKIVRFMVDQKIRIAPTIF